MPSPSESETPTSLLETTSLVHGVYYIITGFWPLLSIRTFQIVSGPKRDLWLVKTAGTLIGVIGATLALGGRRRRVTPELSVLGIGSAVGIACIDVVYVRRGVIWPVYLAEAFLEIGLTALWFFGLSSRREARTR
jgi:hypothetical protein